MNDKREDKATPAEVAELAKLAQEQAQSVLKKLPLIGPIAWLMLQQSVTRNVLLADLEWRILPPLVLEQAKLYMKDTMPLAFASWARLSAEAAARFRQPPHRLAPSDWKSGEQIWIVDVIAPFGAAQEVLKDLREQVFPGHSLFQLAPVSPEAVKVIEWPALHPKTH
jgi:cytolysin-activating lysine-acyltransferase